MSKLEILDKLGVLKNYIGKRLIYSLYIYLSNNNNIVYIYLIYRELAVIFKYYFILYIIIKIRGDFDYSLDTKHVTP